MRLERSKKKLSRTQWGQLPVWDRPQKDGFVPGWEYFRNLWVVMCRWAAADPGLFQRGGCKYESSRQTSLGQEMGEGELGGNV